MQRRSVSAFLGAIASLVAASCGGSPDESRMARLEERIGALEHAIEARPPAAALPAVADDLQSLERRLTEVERRLAATGTGRQDGVPAAGGLAETRLEERRERRARLRDLTQQYRSRLAAIRAQQSDPAARQQAVREALEWYRDQRRAILAGDEPPTS